MSNEARCLRNIRFINLNIYSNLYETYRPKEHLSQTQKYMGVVGRTNETYFMNSSQIETFFEHSRLEKVQNCEGNIMDGGRSHDHPDLSSSLGLQNMWKTFRVSKELKLSWENSISAACAET